MITSLEIAVTALERIKAGAPDPQEIAGDALDKLHKHMTAEEEPAWATDEDYRYEGGHSD